MTDDYSAFLEDAAHYPGGHASGIVFPRSTEDVADALRSSGPTLPIGAQSSLTGGATPMGERILSTAKLTGIDIGGGRVTVGAGVTVAAMQDALTQTGAWFPPAPTFTGACAGGIVATNAAGAATFKYGSVREWVDALTVVLADGDARPGAWKDARPIGRADSWSRRKAAGSICRCPPTTCHGREAIGRLHAEPGMDLIDLFIGSEGTLGVITRVTFRTLEPAPNIVLAFVPCRTKRQAAIALAGRIRDASKYTWSAAAGNGIDASAIEHMDHRSLQIVARGWRRQAVQRHHSGVGAYCASRAARAQRERGRGQGLRRDPVVAERRNGATRALRRSAASWIVPASLPTRRSRCRTTTGASASFSRFARRCPRASTGESGKRRRLLTIASRRPRRTWSCRSSASAR